MEYTSWLLIGSALLNITVSVMLVAYSSRATAQRFFALSAFLLGLWAAGDTLMLTASSQVWINLGLILFLLAPLAATHFVVIFAYDFLGTPWKSSKAQRSVLWAFSTLTFVVVGVFAGSVATIDIGASGNVLVPGPLYAPYVAAIVLHFGMTFAALGYKALTFRDKRRLHIMYCFVGIALTATISLASNIVLPLLGQTEFIWVGPVSTLFYVVAVVLAVAKHRLFDMRILIMRSLAYVFTITTISVLVGVLAYIIAEYVFDKQIDLEIYIVLAVGLAFASVVLRRIKQFFDHVTKNIFYRGTYSSSEVLSDLNQLFITSVNLEDLLSQTADKISSTFQSTYCIIGVKDSTEQGYSAFGDTKRMPPDEIIQKVRKITASTKRQVIVVDELGEKFLPLKTMLQEADIALLTRITGQPGQGTEGIGYIALGPQRSGNRYSSRDIKFLGTITAELVVGIQSALRLQQIEQLNQTLEHRIADATRELRATNDKLKALDVSKDDFISMASHQLRTPLTSIKGYLSMVLEGDGGKVPVQQRKMLEQAFASSQRMTYLISDMLNLSRLKTGKFVIMASDVDLVHVVDQEVNQLRRMAEANDTELVTNLPVSIAMLRLDETKIRQVIMNLVDNAIYYTPKGGTITVALHETPAAVEFTVKDTGIGVPRAEQHKLFTRFYRATNAKRTRPDGTGLGLFMAKKAVVSMGGAIIFRSQEGQGSTFGFTFPKKSKS